MEKRKATIEKGAVLKINTGGYENVEISQSIEVEVEFADATELRKKSDAVTSELLACLKSDAEQTLKETNRRRVVNGQPAELWQ